MKKILTILTILLAFTSSNVSAMELSTSQGVTEKEDVDTSTNRKNAEEDRKSRSKRNSYTQALEKSNSKAIALVKIEQTDILEGLENLELRDIENYENGKTNKLGFWGNCAIITNPKLPSDFGITAYDSDYDVIDNNLQSLIDNYAKSNTSILKVISKKQEKDLREYMNCLLAYGIVGAQSLVSGKFTLNITDKNIIRMNKTGRKNLKRNRSCRFHKSSDMIQCGSLKVHLDYEPTLLDKQISYFSKDRYLGLSGTETYTDTTNNSSRDEDSKTTESSYTNTKSTDRTTTTRVTDSQDKSTKTEISARGFFSKLFK